MSPTRHRNLTIIMPCIAAIGVMLGLVAYSPTLYRLFCAATGYGGTTQRADSGSDTVSERLVTVQFDSNVAPGLPWRFEPVQRKVKIHLGEQKLVFFTAENRSDEAIVGHATFNVTPASVGIYFKKIQCFCFDEERLNAHQKVDMPVVFYVDPVLADDRETRDVDSVTLSYTFFRSANPERARDLLPESLSASATVSSVANGQKRFAERCHACHALDANQLGPKLDGVFGRRAGSVPNYIYSDGLRNANFTWTAETLDRWLTNPQKLLPGAKMPVRIMDASLRRDIISYLQEEQRSAQKPSGKRGNE